MNKRLLRSALALAVSATAFSAGAAQAAPVARCRPTPITRLEAIRAIRLAPISLEFSRAGKSVTADEWTPPPSEYRTRAFFLFMVLAPKPSDTPIIGYFGVNKWTADVLDQNGDGEFETNAPLRRYQDFLRRKHCLNPVLKSRRFDTLQGRD